MAKSMNLEKSTVTIIWKGDHNMHESTWTIFCPLTDSVSVMKPSASWSVEEMHGPNL